MPKKSESPVEVEEVEVPTLEWSSKLEYVTNVKVRKMLQTLAKKTTGEQLFELTGLYYLYQDDVDKLTTEAKKMLNDPWSLEVYDKSRNDKHFEVQCFEKPLTVESGVFKCGKCGSDKTMSYGMQTRSADEPMTQFVTCCNPKPVAKDITLWKSCKGNEELYLSKGGKMGRCGHKWKQ